MAINNPEYATMGTAKRGAVRKGINNPKFVPTDEGKVEVRDMDRPLYNGSARERSKVKGPVKIVWDLCHEMIPAGKKRKDIVAAAVELGVAINTAKAQYQLYREAAGLVKKRAAA